MPQPVLRADLPVYLLTGPTAVGKTALALAWAQQLGAEIVNADALLFYRGMDIGTAKPTAQEREVVPHHLIDICAPEEQMDIDRYVHLALQVVADIQGRGHPVLVTGGSGFYLKAFYAPVTDGLAATPEASSECRQLESRGLPAMIERLRELNPDGLGNLHLANPRRVYKALERCLSTGRTLKQLQADFARRQSPLAAGPRRIVLLERSREQLLARMARRTHMMLQAGLIDEVLRLRAAGFERNPSAARAIGYRETLAWLDRRAARPGVPGGHFDIHEKQELADEITLRTRQLAARQRKWFRNQLPEPDLTLDLDQTTSAEALAWLRRL